MNFCKNCGGKITDTDKYCKTCGIEIDRNLNYTTLDTPTTLVSNITQPEIVDANVDTEYTTKTANAIALSTIEENLKKLNINPKETTIKIAFDKMTKHTILYSIMNMIIIVFSIVYRFKIPTCLILLLINFIIYFFMTADLNNSSLILRYVKKRPNDKISDIVNEMCDTSNTTYNFKILRRYIILASIVLAIIPFIKPFYIYEKNDTGYSIKYYVAGIVPKSKIEIPSTHKGKNITIIRGNAFKDIRNVKEIIVPDTITTINGHAFENNYKLEKIVLSNNLEEINGYTFKNDKSLTEINIPSNLISIGGHAFENCTSLSNINLPNTLKQIYGHAFDGATNISYISLPDSLEYIGGGAFRNCTSLSSITIPEKVTEIQGNTFENCTSLANIKLHDNITSIHGESFRNCTSLTNITLPSKITEIRGNTFENCTSLISIIIPDGVTKIKGHAFYGCSSLYYVKIPDTLTEIGSSAFRKCSSLKNITIPEGTYVNERAFKESPTHIERKEIGAIYE